ncbi:CPBP family intramembrane glutamic endopeptidase [Pontibacter sp. H249]|uniref:CPBP family intramembrane glutamic endopeptidase n=1 Tax=Pontibacter sp. H249 TaxID=3133420 RepID=UPI0030BF4C6D
MVGNLFILVVSWFLLRLERKQLGPVLGVSNPMYRLFQFGMGFSSTAILAILTSLVFALTANFTWVPTGSATLEYLLKGFYNVFNAVLFEELIFRGYLLYKALEYLGERKACFLSAGAFGVYHWFTFSTFGNPVLMGWVFFYTGVWGLMFAYAYTKTRSLALPIGLHLGWNLVDQYIFSKTSLSLFEPVTTIHTRYLGTLESMMFLNLPTIGFAVLVILLLSKVQGRYSTR